LPPQAGGVVVGHSLGGVVCAELLAEDEVRRRTSLFVAVGAPLGLDAVTAGMRPPGAARPASPWVNVYDPRDWATLGSPLPRGGGLGEQLAVANPRSQEHSIEHYLAHPEVATVIADHLGHAPPACAGIRAASRPASSGRGRTGGRTSRGGRRRRARRGRRGRPPAPV